MCPDILTEIKRIEEELRRTPYNKATEKHIGKLKAKLAKLKEKVEKSKSTRKSQFYFKKDGDATVVMVGYPSVGKSSLLNALTGAKSCVADYDFTTLEPVPGILKYQGAKIQIVDTPGLIEGASSGRGKGKEVLSLARIADLILIVTDVYNVDKIDIIKKELEKSGIRLDKSPPAITIKRKDKGGIRIFSTHPLSISQQTIYEILKEFRIHNADVTIREPLTSIDRFIDGILRNRVYIPSLTVINKIDLAVPWVNTSDVLFVSAKNKINLDILAKKIYEKLNLIKIYLKPPNEKPSKDPLILRRGATVEDVCRKIHKDLIHNFKYAKVWGKSVKFNGQRVGLDHKLEDGDIITVYA